MHNPNCAVTRWGELRSQCDCGFDAGRLHERKLIVERLRFGEREFYRLGEDYKEWNLVAEIMGEEADVIETGNY